MTASINESLLPCPFCGLSDAHLTSGGPGNHFVRCDHCLASTDDGSKERAIAAWNRRQSPAGVEVKPLEWHERVKGVQRAETVVGDYRVWTHHEADGVVFWQLSDGGIKAAGQGTEAECFAAAQADYERRVLSSLSVKEPAGVEPVAWQRRLKYPDVAGVVPQWKDCSAAEATGHFEKSPHHEYRSLYASPPKAVTITDEMVERGLAEYSEGGCSGLADYERREVVVSILTAALSSEARNGQ